MNVARRIHHSWAHLIARISRRYYLEDFVRVYPDEIRFDKRGRRRQGHPKDIRNFLNHVKFYRFAAQFVDGKRVADIGCGSGYGCRILMESGSTKVCGTDISKAAINFARSRYSGHADFRVQGITNLKEYEDGAFDVTICSEVLEHIKEYGMERRALQELKRITKAGGLIVVGTPNSELLGDHGFQFEEIRQLFADEFGRFCIFENALVPFGDRKSRWEKRLASGETGIIITENINLSETVLPEEGVPEIKQGLAPGRMRLAHFELDTNFLHNTHSWVVLAVMDGPERTTAN
jgi:2-polyprenyl-3-methyl-5-hydroxy-6-metoxy-1,4-benzoquinol methylase